MDRPRPGPSGSSLDDEMAHFGVKGMKWGKRRGHSGGTSASKFNGKGFEPSVDSVRSDRAKAVVKGSGSKALSNVELQHLVTRMNLEQQYSKLSTHTTVISAGRKFSVDVLRDVGKDSAKKVVQDIVFKPVIDVLLKRKP